MAKFDSLYMSFAVANALRSKDGRSKVGAVFVKDDRVLSHGWNGTPPGESNQCQDEFNVTMEDKVIHAEINAVLRAARDGQALKGSTVYCTHSPCLGCARKLQMVGIERFVFIEKYRITTGIEYLLSRGVIVEQIEF